MQASSHADRVREHTSEDTNLHLDREAERRVQHYAGKRPEGIAARIAELDREWDIERVLEMNASLLAFTGVTLGALRNQRWLVIPSVVLPFLFQHAVQGWCPPVPLFRRLGIRTRKEIDRERYALKALRGDFAAVSSTPPAERGQEALRAVAL